EDDFGAPGVGVAKVGGERIENGIAQGQRHEARRNILLDETDAEATGADDLTMRELLLTGDAAQERGLAIAVAGDEADAIPLPDHEAEVVKERVGGDDAGGVEADGAHFIV